MLVAPNAVLLVLPVVPDVSPAVRPLNQGRALQDSVRGSELSEVPFVHRIGLDEPLLPLFLALLERSDLHDLVVFVHQDAETVRDELLVDGPEVLAPVVAAFVVAVGDEVVLHELSLLDEDVVHVLLQVEHEWLVLSHAVLHILIHLGNIRLDPSQHIQLLLYGLLLILLAQLAHLRTNRLQLPTPILLRQRRPGQLLQRQLLAHVQLVHVDAHGFEGGAEAEGHVAEALGLLQV